MAFNTLDGTLISPFSNITLARFGGWRVTLIRDDGITLTPTTLDQTNSKIFFTVRDQDDVTRILSSWQNTVFSDDAIDSSKNFKFNEVDSSWTFNFPEQSDGWVPADSPLGFKLIILPRADSSSLLSNNTIDTQMAKVGNGGTSVRINDADDFSNTDNLIKQGAFTVLMPTWKVNFATNPNPGRTITTMLLTENPAFVNDDLVISCEGTKDITIVHEIRYRTSIPGVQRDGIDRLETFGDDFTFGVLGENSFNGAPVEMRVVHAAGSSSAVITKIVNLTTGAGPNGARLFRLVGDGDCESNFSTFDSEGNLVGGATSDIFSSFVVPKNFDTTLGQVPTPFP